MSQSIFSPQDKIKFKINTVHVYDSYCERFIHICTIQAVIKATSSLKVSSMALTKGTAPPPLDTTLALEEEPNG